MSTFRWLLTTQFFFGFAWASLVSAGVSIYVQMVGVVIPHDLWWRTSFGGFGLALILAMNIRNRDPRQG